MKEVVDSLLFPCLHNITVCVCRFFDIITSFRNIFPHILLSWRACLASQNQLFHCVYYKNSCQSRKKPTFVKYSQDNYQTELFFFVYSATSDTLPALNVWNPDKARERKRRLYENINSNIFLFSFQKITLPRNMQKPYYQKSFFIIVWSEHTHTHIRAHTHIPLFYKNFLFIKDRMKARHFFIIIC